MLGRHTRRSQRSNTWHECRAASFQHYGRRPNGNALFFASGETFAHEARGHWALDTHPHTPQEQGPGAYNWTDRQQATVAT